MSRGSRCPFLLRSREGTHRGDSLSPPQDSSRIGRREKATNPPLSVSWPHYFQLGLVQDFQYFLQVAFGYQQAKPDPYLPRVWRLVPQPCASLFGERVKDEILVPAIYVYIN